MNKVILVVLILLSISCHRSNNETIRVNDREEKSVAMEFDEKISKQSLVLLIHSGNAKMIIQDDHTTVISECQIIYCSSDTLKYGYGSVLAETDTLENDMKWFYEYTKIENYSIRERCLDTEEMTFVSNAIRDLSNSRYESSSLVKDDWNYILYVNNIKVASGNVSSIESFPKKIYIVIKQLLTMASPLYPRNSFA